MEDENRYFESYASSGIHEEMIKDSTRTKSYRRAILNNNNLFAGKIVLDVGCGTGILSMFAADAGAKHVYAIDNSSVAEQARKIVERNGFSKKITVIRGLIESIELPVDKVDIIVSEWMGYALLYESMLDSVIFARDKWLANGGIMFPDSASIYLVGIEDEEYRDLKVNWWTRVYTYDMIPMSELALSEPIVDHIEADCVVTTNGLVRHFDLYTVKINEIHNVESNVILLAKRQDFIHAVALYFTVDFSACHKPITISTAPNKPQTHWKQTIMYVTNVIPIHVDESIFFKVKITQCKVNKRCIDFTISQYGDESFKILLQNRSYNFS